MLAIRHADWNKSTLPSSVVWSESNCALAATQRAPNKSAVRNMTRISVKGQGGHFRQMIITRIAIAMVTRNEC